MKITEVTPQKNNSSRVSVYSDGKYLLSLDEVDAVVLGIKPGKEITETELNNLLYESEFGKAKAKALDILSSKSVSAAMLSDVLEKKGYDRVVVTEVINEFTDLGYIDDFNYTMLFLEHASEKLWGKKKIVYELGQKGVDSYVIEDALAEYSSLPGPEEISQAIGAKYSGEDISDYKIKQKIIRFFASRGFDFSEINEGIGIYLQNIKD